jgi:hypothetical protein
MLIRTRKPWRLDWLSSGLYDDGWTKPGVTATVRIYPSPRQRRPLVRFLTIALQAPTDVGRRPVELVTNLRRWNGTASNAATVRTTLRVCVPPSGYTDVTLRATGKSNIPGDLKDLNSSLAPRTGGVHVTEIAEADETGGPCRLR